MNNKLEYFQKQLNRHGMHEYQTQIEQYIASHYLNEPKNTPSKIERRLKEFFPGIRQLFDNAAAYVKAVKQRNESK